MAVIYILIPVFMYVVTKSIVFGFYDGVRFYRSTLKKEADDGRSGSREKDIGGQTPS